MNNLSSVKVNKAETKKESIDMTNLKKILSVKRPSSGRGQYELLSSLRDEASKANIKVFCESKKYLILKIGELNIGYVAHLDTVHRTEGPQDIIVHNGKVSAVGAECLGADDGAGIWLLVEMMRAKKPGYYVFTTDEEIGCVGAEKMVEEIGESEWYKDIQWFVEFDRKGTAEVIYDNFGGLCASKEDAQTMCDFLGLGHVPSAHGCFTDIVAFAKTTRACLNISAGYKGAHTPQEELDLSYLFRLRNKICSLDWSTLKTPIGYKEDPKMFYSYGMQGSFLSNRHRRTRGTSYKTYPKSNRKYLEDMEYDNYDYIHEGGVVEATSSSETGCVRESLRDLIRTEDDVDDLVDFIETMYGTTADEFLDFIGRDSFRQLDNDIPIDTYDMPDYDPKRGNFRR